jgi:hypothetical protein
MVDNYDKQYEIGDMINFTMDRDARFIKAGDKVIKIVAGKGGDKIQITDTYVKNGDRLFPVDGSRIVKKYQIAPEVLNREVTVPAGHIFVVGQTDYSWDSRFGEQYQKRQSQEKHMPSSECLKKLLFCFLLATPLTHASDSVEPAGTQSMESVVGTPRYNPSSVSDSVRAVIEHTGKLREANTMSEVAKDIKENQPTEVFSEDAEKINQTKNETMRTQSSSVEKMFGKSGITAQDFERKLDNNKNEELSTDNGLTIFASFSMPDYVLTDLIKTASENNARVVFRGLKDGVENLIQMQVVLRNYIANAK